MVLALRQKCVEQFAAVEADSAEGALIEGAVLSLEAASRAIAGDDIDGRCEAVRNATEAVATLILNLDLRRSGEMADYLIDLYSEVLGCLLRVNLYNNADSAEQAMSLLEPLRSTTGARLRPLRAQA